jgi:hypothetical protein
MPYRSPEQGEKKDGRGKHKQEARAILRAVKQASVTAKALHQHLGNIHGQTERMAAAIGIATEKASDERHLGSMLESMHEHIRLMDAHDPLTKKEFNEHRARVRSTVANFRRASTSAKMLAEHLDTALEHVTKISS